MNFRFYNSLMILFTFFIFSCAKQNVDIVQVENQTITEKPEDLHPSIVKLDSMARQEWKWLYLKLDVNYADSEKQFSFKTSFKSTKDSASNALITFSRIPIFNALITPDSILLINKRDRCYSEQSVAYFREILGIDLSLENVQELILGLPLNFNPKYHYLIEEKDGLTTLKYKEISSPDIEHSAKEYEFTYIINSMDFSLKSELIESKKDQTKIEVQYLERQNFNGFEMPSKMLIHVTSLKNNISIEITYEKTEMNIPQEINLSKPLSYEKCN